MANVVGEFIGVLGLKINKTEWDTGEARIKSFAENFKGMALGIVAAVAGIAAFEDHLAKMTTKMSNTSQILQMPVGQIQALKVAAEEAQVPVQTVMGAIGSLQTNLVNLRSGFGLSDSLRYGLGDIQRNNGVVLNMKNYKTGFDAFKAIMEQIAKTKGTQNKEGELTRIFGNADLLPFVAHGVKNITKAYDELKSRGLLITPQQQAQSKEYTKNMALLNMEFKNMFAQLGYQLMPVFNEFAKQANNLFKDKNFIEGLKAILGVLDAVAFVLKEIVKLIGFVAKAGVDSAKYVKKIPIPTSLGGVSVGGVESVYSGVKSLVTGSTAKGMLKDSGSLLNKVNYQGVLGDIGSFMSKAMTFANPITDAMDVYNYVSGKGATTNVSNQTSSNKSSTVNHTVNNNTTRSVNNHYYPNTSPSMSSVYMNKGFR